jgi:hypothetical protein
MRRPHGLERHSSLLGLPRLRAGWKAPAAFSEVRVMIESRTDACYLCGDYGEVQDGNGNWVPCPACSATAASDDCHEPGVSEPDCP